MDRDIFELHLRTAADHAAKFARRYVRQFLPNDVAFRVYPNQSYDGNPRIGDEITFPDESLSDGKYLGPWSTEEVVQYLWRNGKVPEWIDASVEAEDGRNTLIALMCCGRYSAQEDRLYYVRGDIPPFGIKSPAVPPEWKGVESTEKFDLYWQSRKRRKLQVWWYRLKYRCRWFRR